MNVYDKTRKKDCYRLEQTEKKVIIDKNFGYYILVLP